MSHSSAKVKQAVESKTSQAYPRFAQIDGRHPFREAVPNGFVDYAVRTRHGGEVFYFNFDLAKEMGLIPKNHPKSLNKELCEAILYSFSLQIINEYDLIHKTRIPQQDIRPHKYMATRYLQVQHPDKRGLTSGDGRSIWNGFISNTTGTWDLSSCGTGATRLSPATAIENRFFKTGDRQVSYGGGRADLSDDMCAAILSEIFHRSNVLTERTLAVIRFSDNSSIRVRAYRNLLRPAHFFWHIKQANYDGLKGSVDYYITRQVSNGDWPLIRDSKKRYRYFLERITIEFARIVAQFELEYIFCWLDWDGDNILSDGAIIDYGSVRQLGLYHHEYRYDDVDRMSTSITEQKNKAKYIVQTFAQIVDFILTKKKKEISAFSNHKIFKLFNQVYQDSKDEGILYKMGFSEQLQGVLLDDPVAIKNIRKFAAVCRYFEKAKSEKGAYEVKDGITWDAVYCLRDILRELPDCYFRKDKPIVPQNFLEVIRSNYASEEDVIVTRGRKVKIATFQELYWQLVGQAANLSGRPIKAVLREMADRSALINRYDRVTGDSIIHVADELIANSASMNANELHTIFSHFVENQVLRPEYFVKSSAPVRDIRNKKAKKVFKSMLSIVKDFREGI